MTKILVTGGAGFIGSHLCERLLSEQNSVVCVDDLNDFYSPKIKEKNLGELRKDKKFKFYKEDILDAGAMDEIIRDEEIDTIIHLAARAGVRPSLQQPALYAKVNVEGTVNLLEAARKNNIKNFIFGSSSSVYGINSKVPYTEKDPVEQPISPYAATKRAGELICFTYNHLYGMNISSLRFFTVYGPRQRPEMAIHKFTQLIDEGKEIEVYGDGTTKRDYTYITDIIDGITATMKKNRGNNIYNLGNSSTVELNQLIKLIEDELGKKAKIRKMPNQPGDVPITYADIMKSKKMLDYQPKVRIEDGIRRFTEWFKQQKK
jgi:UDP-glucuronate 4-epimerase